METYSPLFVGVTLVITVVNLWCDVIDASVRASLATVMIMVMRVCLAVTMIYYGFYDPLSSAIIFGAFGSLLIDDVILFADHVALEWRVRANSGGESATGCATDPRH